MIILVTGRQGGKTTQAIRWWLIDPGARVLYVSDFRCLEHTQNKANKMTPNWSNGQRQAIKRNIRVFPYSDITRTQAVHEQCGIDDLDAVLHNILGFTPGFITTTGMNIGKQDTTNG